MTIAGLYIVNKHITSLPIYYFLDGKTFRGCKSNKKYHLKKEEDGDRFILISEENSRGEVYVTERDLIHNVGVPC